MNDLCGKVIHCKNIEEMEALLKEIAHVYVTASYIWNYNGNDGLRRDCVHIGKTGNFAGFSSKKYYEEENFIITEFSDLKNNKIENAIKDFDRYLSRELHIATDQNVAVYEHWIDCMLNIQEALKEKAPLIEEIEQE